MVEHILRDQRLGLKGNVVRSADIKTKIKAHKYEKTGILKHIKNTLNRNKIGEILVLQGVITPSDLKTILKRQHNSGKPLGQILLESQIISKRQLSRLLLKQKMLRIAATTLLYMMSCTSFMKMSYASDIKDVPARITLASAGSHAFKAIKQYPALFGADEKQSTNLKAFTKWTEMFDRFDRELSNSKSDRIVNDLKIQLSQYKSDSIYDMAQNVNAMMNKQKYIVDSKNWGKSDYWATPIEFMTRGGDCEDFAIAKYVAMRVLGVPENRMRIAIVQDQKKNMPHAILIVYSEKGAVVLDNQIKEIRYAKSIHHYKPIFSINRQAWWLHTTPETSSNTIVASAE
tara:strand:- start:3532 stop:4563 length:1032 start_codon:yes stop_codon:yes gene_type:complete